MKAKVIARVTDKQSRTRTPRCVENSNIMVQSNANDSSAACTTFLAITGYKISHARSLCYNLQAKSLFFLKNSKVTVGLSACASTEKSWPQSEDRM